MFDQLTPSCDRYTDVPASSTRHEPDGDNTICDGAALRLDSTNVEDPDGGGAESDERCKTNSRPNAPTSRPQHTLTPAERTIEMALDFIATPHPK
jgi:hypothetical protein